MAELLPNLVQLWQDTLHWQPETEQQQAFQVLYEGLLELNQQINLTRITGAEDFWEKHLWDSLQGIAPWLTVAPGATLGQEMFKVIDIGTGGGFPGLPIALVRPAWQVTLLDATRKKIAAIQSLGQCLGLSNVNFLAERAEHVGHQPMHREAYDLALVRAVGSTNACAEYALPLVKPDGCAVLYRGQWDVEEETHLKAVLPRLGGKLVAVRKAETPMTRGLRHYVEILKVSRTPDKFPRAAGMPAKAPLSG